MLACMAVTRLEHLHSDCQESGFQSIAPNPAMAQNVSAQFDAQFQHGIFQQTNIQNNVVLVRNEIQVAQQAQPNRAKELAKGAMDVAKSLKDNTDNLKSGDDMKIAMGSLALAGSVLACCGPAGAAAGAVCALTGAIMGCFMSSDSQNIGKVVNQIVQAHFRQFKDQELQEKAKSVLDIVTLRTTQLRPWLGGQLNATERGILPTLLADLDYFHALRPLREQIEMHATCSDDMADRAAQYVFIYAMIASALQVFYAQLAAVMGANGMPNLQNSAVSTAEELGKYHREAMQVVREPKEGGGRFYRKLHVGLSTDQRQFMTAFLAQFGCPMKGRLCRIFNEHHQLYLGPVSIWSKDGDRAGLGAVPAGGTFRIFGPERCCTIYSIDLGGYIYAADYAPFDGDRRNVWAWTPGNRVNQGSWDISGGTIFNLKQEEYMYAADYAAFGNAKRVFTWRPRNMVKQGYWRVEDTDYSTGALTPAPQFDCCVQ